MDRAGARSYELLFDNSRSAKGFATLLSGSAQFSKWPTSPPPPPPSPLLCRVCVRVESETAAAVYYVKRSSARACGAASEGRRMLL